jgi:hypothetical protein
MAMRWTISFRRYEMAFNYLLIRKRTPSLVVVFSDFRPGQNGNPEFFSRVSWASDLDASFLFVADPGIQAQPGIRGTWFQGLPEMFAIERVSFDIKVIANEFGFDLKRTVLHGFSHGGFAALATAAYIPGAATVVEAPQTIVTAYEGKRDLTRMAQTCYFVENHGSIGPQFASRLDLRVLYKTRHTPSATILVKETDTHHLESHIRPLAEAMPPDRLTLKILTGELGEGRHQPLPKEMVLAEIAEILKAREPKPLPAAAPPAVPATPSQGKGKGKGKGKLTPKKVKNYAVKLARRVIGAFRR